MDDKANSLKKEARLAGLLYLSLAIAGAYGILYVPSQIMVKGNAAATVNNILANEFLFRTGIVSQLISSIIFIFLVLVLYRLLKMVNEYNAKLMLVLVIVQIPIVFILETLNITALMILKGEIMKTSEPEKAKDLAMLFLRTHDYGINILEIFWGLWLIPFGQLVYKSKFIPRILGLLLIMGGIAYIIQSLTFLFFPDNRIIVHQFTFAFYSIAEISTMLWLLIKGIKSKY